MPFSEPCYKVSIYKLGGVLFGVAALALMIGALFVPHHYEAGMIGVAYVMCAIACCLWVRQWFGAMATMMRETFLAGVEAGRAQERVERDTVRSLR